MVITARLEYSVRVSVSREELNAYLISNGVKVTEKNRKILIKALSGTAYACIDGDLAEPEHSWNAVHKSTFEEEWKNG